jgi:hypothetical protein
MFVTAGITVSLLNVYYLDEITDFFNKMNITYYLNILKYPLKLNITTLPKSKKEEVMKKINFNEIKGYMNSKDTSIHLNQTIEYLKKLDIIRNTDYKKVIPFLNFDDFIL